VILGNQLTLTLISHWDHRHMLLRQTFLLTFFLHKWLLIWNSEGFFPLVLQTNKQTKTSWGVLKHSGNAYINSKIRLDKLSYILRVIFILCVCICIYIYIYIWIYGGAVFMKTRRGIQSPWVVVTGNCTLHVMRAGFWFSPRVALYSLSHFSVLSNYI
jgi:hypothetical protein